MIENRINNYDRLLVFCFVVVYAFCDMDFPVSVHSAFCFFFFFLFLLSFRIYDNKKQEEESYITALIIQTKHQKHSHVDVLVCTKKSEISQKTMQLCSYFPKKRYRLNVYGGKKENTIHRMNDMGREFSALFFPVSSALLCRIFFGERVLLIVQRGLSFFLSIVSSFFFLCCRKATLYLSTYLLRMELFVSFPIALQ